MGFESSHAARRRLAVLAMQNDCVQEALAPATFPGFGFSADKPVPEAVDEPAHDVVHHLDKLAQEIVATPGAGGALLVAFANQGRALALVMEAALRTPASAALPEEVIAAVRNALRVPPAAVGLNFI